MISTEQLNVSLANVSPADAKFIRGVIKVFTDPDYACAAQALRQSQVGIHYDPKDGCCCVADLNSLQPGKN